MSFKLEQMFLLVILLLFCAFYPLNFKQEQIEFLKKTQTAYEADYLAWEIKTYKKIDSSVLPSQSIQFYCYDEDMELEIILTSADNLDFSPYFCVIFTHGTKEGICLV